MKLPVTQIKDSDWGVSFTNQEGDTAENFVVQRENGKNFHVTMIDPAERRSCKISSADDFRARSGRR